MQSLSELTRELLALLGTTRSQVGIAGAGGPPEVIQIQLRGLVDLSARTLEATGHLIEQLGRGAGQLREAAGVLQGVQGQAVQGLLPGVRGIAELIGAVGAAPVGSGLLTARASELTAKLEEAEALIRSLKQAQEKATDPLLELIGVNDVRLGDAAPVRSGPKPTPPEVRGPVPIAPKPSEPERSGVVPGPKPEPTAVKGGLPETPKPGTVEKGGITLPGPKPGLDTQGPVKGGLPSAVGSGPAPLGLLRASVDEVQGQVDALQRQMVALDGSAANEKLDRAQGMLQAALESLQAASETIVERIGS